MRAPKFAWNPKRVDRDFCRRIFWKGRRHRRDSPQENRCWKARPEKQSPFRVSISWRPCLPLEFPPQKSRRSAWLATEFFEKFRRRQPTKVAVAGAMRRSSRQATPAFLRAVASCLHPSASEINSSRCGAWPKQKQDSASLFLASSRKNPAASDPGAANSFCGFFCFGYFIAAANKSAVCAART